MQTIAPITTDRVRLRTFFIDDYLFCKGSLLFSYSILVLPYYCLHIILKVLRSKYAKTIRFNIEQVSFSEELFKHAKNFTVTFPEHHFVVSTMTARGVFKWLAQAHQRVRVLAHSLQ